MVESTLFRGIFAPNQRTHPVAGALGDSSNSPGRRVKNLVNEERQIFKGKAKAKGTKRLSGIKQATRVKFAKENDQKFDDETGLLEFGPDPFSKRIINTPTFTSSPSLTLNEIDDIQYDEDAKFSLFANDIIQCHSQDI
ncbi:hypothetical protein V6N13_016468 [Hibiscus sabdariffa]